MKCNTLVIARFRFIALLVLSVLRVLNADVDLLQDSSFWPAKVTVCERLETNDTNEKKVILREGTIGVLQRIENGLALIDFGRYGLFWLQPEKTDFLERAQRLKNKQEFKDFPNALVQIGNKMIQYPEGNAKHVLLDDIKGYKYFLCYYVNEISRENVRITKALNDAFKDGWFSENSIWPVAFLGENQWYGYFQKNLNDLPAFIPHMRLSYAAALMQEPSPTPSFVLIDANGKILYRSEQLKLVKPKLKTRIFGFRSLKKVRLSFIHSELEKALKATEDE